MSQSSASTPLQIFHKRQLSGKNAALAGIWLVYACSQIPVILLDGNNLAESGKFGGLCLPVKPDRFDAEIA